MMYYKNRMTEDEVYQRSRGWAEMHLKEGRLGVRIFGLIRNTEALKQAYKEKGVDCQIIAGDCVCSLEVADAKGYNEVMEPEIIKKYPGFFQEVRLRHLLLRANWDWKNGCENRPDDFSI